MNNPLACTQHSWSRQWELCSPRNFGSTTPTAIDLTHALTPSSVLTMGRQGHIPGAAPPYTFKHLLDDLKLLNIMSDETWGHGTSALTWKVFTHTRCPRVSYISRWMRVIGVVARSVEIWHNWHISSSLCWHRLVQNAHYGVTMVWCHSAQSKVNIQATLSELEDHNLSDGPLTVLAQVFSNDPQILLVLPFMGLTIHNDP